MLSVDVPNLMGGGRGTEYSSSSSLLGKCGAILGGERE